MSVSITEITWGFQMYIYNVRIPEAVGEVTAK